MDSGIIDGVLGFGDLVQPPAVGWWLAKLVLGGVAAFVLAALASSTVRLWILPKPADHRFRDHVLFESVLSDGATIRCLDGTLVATIVLSGLDLETLRPEDRTRWWQRRKMWVDRLGDFPGLCTLVISQRRLHDHVGNMEGYDDGLLARMQRVWHGQFSRSYRNSHAVILWVPGGARAGRENLKAAANETLQLLKEFSAQQLFVGKPGGRSPLLSFWAGIANPGRDVTVCTADGGEGLWTPNFGVAGVPGGPPPLGKRLADELIASCVAFNDGSVERADDGLIEFREGGRQRFMMAVSPTRLGDVSSAELPQRILGVDAEVMVAQWVRVIEPSLAELRIAEMEKRDPRTGFSVNARDQFAAAREIISGTGSISGNLVKHQMTVFVLGGTRDAVLAGVEAVTAAFRHHENQCVRECAESEVLYLSLFPPGMGSPDDTWYRSNYLFTNNIADLVSFETPAQGLTACDWGDRPVTDFRTARGNAFSFCWHTKPAPLAAGHTLIVGSTGGGKTVLISFLALSSLGYDNARVFMFDREDGAYVATKAFGGTYVHFGAAGGRGEGCFLNPLQMDLRAHGDWVITWLRDHVMRTDSAATERELTRVVRGMESLPKADRSLNELARVMDAGLDGMDNLQSFVAEGAYADVFNAEKDTFADLADSSRLVTFDASHFLKDEKLSEALLPYLTYRISSSMTAIGAPWLLVLDEAPALWHSARMRDWTVRELQEARKNRGVVVIAVQRLGNFAEAGMTDLISQCPRRILLRADEAGDEYISLLGISAADLDAVKGLHPLVQDLTHFAVVKEDGGGSVIIDTNMNRGLDAGEDGHFLKLLESGRGPADRARALMQGFGEDWPLRMMRGA